MPLKTVLGKAKITIKQIPSKNISNAAHRRDVPWNVRRSPNPPAPVYLCPASPIPPIIFATVFGIFTIIVIFAYNTLKIRHHDFRTIL